MSAKTVRNIHGVLHKALQQAVKNKYIRFNPADDPVLPTAEKPEIKPFDDEQIKAFLKAVKGHKYEFLFLLTNWVNILPQSRFMIALKR